MTFLDAAYEILKRVGQPLRYAEIAGWALVAGLLVTRGQTPEVTTASLHLYMHSILGHS